MEIFLIIASPTIAAFLSFACKRRPIIEAASIIASLASFVFSIFIALEVASSGHYTPSEYFSVDALGAIILMTVSLVGLASSFYSRGYLREETSKQIIGFSRVKQYFVLFNLFLAAMFFAITTTNPIIMWISIEATTLSTAFLISFYNKPSALEAAWKYLIINSIGLLLGFLGTLLYFTSIKSTDGHSLINWSDLLSNAQNLDPFIAKIAFIFILIGYGTKIGFSPMHTWKPDAYSKAPTPIAALFSGALLNVAFLAVLKFKLITDLAIGHQFSQKLLIVFGILSIVVAALIIFIQKNYKRLLAYSSIEHAGIIALGFAFGGLGSFAAILHMIYHSLVKSALFFSAGNIFLKYSSTKITTVKGAISAIPTTSVLFLAGLIAITGVPPFGLFLTKTYILSEGIKTHPLLTVVALFSFIIIFIGFLRHATAMIFGDKPEETIKTKENNWLVLPIIVLMIVAFYLSFNLPPFINTLINSAASNY